jgi:hypothetical protein
MSVSVSEPRPPQAIVVAAIVLLLLAVAPPPIEAQHAAAIMAGRFTPAANEAVPEAAIVSVVV